MKFRINNKYFRWGLTAFLTIAGGITFYYFIFHSSNIRSNLKALIGILMPVVLGLIIAYLLTPVLNFIEDRILFPICEKLKVKDFSKKNSIIRGIGILVTAFLFAALISVLFSMLLSQIVPSIQNIVGNFDLYTNNFIRWLNRILEDNPDIGGYVVKNVNRYSGELEKWINDFVLTRTSSLIMTVSQSILNVFNVLWDCVIGFIISIYVMAGKERFAGQAKKITYAVFERDTANNIIRNCRFTHKTFIGFISGKIVDSIIIGIICFIGTSLLHTPYAALVSVIIGVTNIIPFFGPFLGAIPCTILIFIVDPVHPLNCLYFIIFILALQQFDGNILGPKILGGSTGLTGFWVIFSLTLFGGLFGVFGMVIGVPIFAVFYAAIRSLVNTSLQKKAMPCDTRQYENLDYVDMDGFHVREPAGKAKNQNKIIGQDNSRDGNNSGGQDNSRKQDKIIDQDNKKKTE